LPDKNDGEKSAPAENTASPAIREENPPTQPVTEINPKLFTNTITPRAVNALPRPARPDNYAKMIAMQKSLASGPMLTTSA